FIATGCHDHPRADFLCDLQRRARDAAADAEDENGFAGLKSGVGNQHTPKRDENQRKRRCLFEGIAGWNRKTILRRQFYILSIGSWQSFAQYAQAKAHEVSIGKAKFTLAAAGRGIQANPIANSYVLDALADVDNDSGAVGTKNVRHGYAHAS